MDFRVKLSVEEQNRAFVSKDLNNEAYALVYSKTISEINDGLIKEETDEDKLNGFVVICSEKKRVYRKCRSFNGVKSGEIELGYRTIAELSSKIGSFVYVKPINWFAYYWHCPENGLKHSFRVAFIGLLASILSLIIGVISLFVEFPII